jgi:hypothetical protein
MWSIIAFGSLSISFVKIPTSSPVIIDGNILVKVATYKFTLLSRMWVNSALLDTVMRKAGKTREIRDTVPSSISGLSRKTALRQKPRKAQMSRT